MQTASETCKPLFGSDELCLFESSCIKNPRWLEKVSCLVTALGMAVNHSQCNTQTNVDLT